MSSVTEWHTGAIQGRRWSCTHTVIGGRGVTAAGRGRRCLPVGQAARCAVGGSRVCGLALGVGKVAGAGVNRTGESGVSGLTGAIHRLALITRQ